MLKLKFESELIFQQQAIVAITDIFKGQQIKTSHFTVPADPTIFNYGNVTELGYANRLDLLDHELLNNIRKLQMKNNLPLAEELNGKNFTVEMETGTGKTYVYTRTIFELNRLYGFTKFIIVVPSVAIREGVYKSLQITEDHFKTLYPGQPYKYFLYDSDKLGMVRGFATSNNIEIMIINIDAFRKSFDDPERENKANLIHRPSDKLSGRKPIEFIQQTNPIVIIDEPQSVDTTPKAKEAIKSLNPLFVLRYSATHKEIYNLMYRLTPVDAYNLGLVKQIKVVSLTSAGNYNSPYIRLMDTEMRAGFSAAIEFDVKRGAGVKRITKKVKSGQNLFAFSGEREQYRGYVVDNINCSPGMEYISFQNGLLVRKGQAIGEISEDDFQRAQIAKTIEEHLLKELVLLPKGIKVLSLFFIDRVANYRNYDQNGVDLGGKFKIIFEEEYRRLINDPRFRVLFLPQPLQEYMLNENVSEVHDGYFSIDNRGRVKDTRGDSAADYSTYDLIMKDKEKLLSFDCPLRFIFSHSALKEGWDNPNVFQVCTLIETADTFTKRQKIGRGLRLCVNQNGERIYDKTQNMLTVVANESFEEFAEKLQQEIEEDTGVKFGILEVTSFAKIPFETETGEIDTLGYEASKELWQNLYDRELIEKDGKITPKLKTLAAENLLELPDKFKMVKDKIRDIILNVGQKVKLYNGNNEVTVLLKKEELENEQFKALWEQIKYKTTYAVEIDIAKFIDECIIEIKKMPPVKPVSIVYRANMVDINESGVQGHETELVRETSLKVKNPLPDLLRYLQDAANIKRDTISKILLKSERLEDFKNNPQVFMDAVALIIKEKLSQMVLGGVKYQKVSDVDCYELKIFDIGELKAYLDQNAKEVNKTVYNYLVYDSDIESTFANGMEIDADVKLYIKLPGKFKVETPIGSYNPDWAVLIEKDGQPRLYFIIETKGTTNQLKLRGIESAKIACGRKHFEAIGTDVKFSLASDYEEFKRAEGIL